MKPDRRTIFEALVLQGLWVIILCVTGQKGWAVRAGQSYQGAAIDYLDQHGNQADGAREVRREISFAGRMQ